MGTTLHVCTTCRAGQPLPEGTDCPGRRLHDALLQEGAPAGVTIRAAELAALSRVARHRAVHRALGDLTTRIHALALDIG